MVNSHDVLIIGGGPAGVAAAIEMRKAGVQKITLLERENYLGGATRHCKHSPFGMREFGRVYFGAAYGKRLEQEIAKFDIDVRYGHSVAQLGDQAEILVSNYNGLEKMNAKRVLVTTGIREKTRAARFVSGDRPIGVLTTGSLQSYVAFHKKMPFKRPVIVGSELVTLSAIWTCLSQGVSPAAVLESRPYPIVSSPLNWFPHIMRIPFYKNAEIIDIIGRERVESVVIRRGETVETIQCDGILFTGQFVPEASLFMSSGHAVDWGSAGPVVDQYGRCENPYYFAAGNVLRAVETGGWAFREGRSVGASLAEDILRAPSYTRTTKVTYDSPIKLVIPNLIRSGEPLYTGGLKDFQLRFSHREFGTITLKLDDHEVWQRKGLWHPERRIIICRPKNVFDAQSVHFSFRRG